MDSANPDFKDWSPSVSSNGVAMLWNSAALLRPIDVTAGAAMSLRSSSLLFTLVGGWRGTEDPEAVAGAEHNSSFELSPEVTSGIYPVLLRKLTPSHGSVIRLITSESPEFPEITRL